MTDRTPRIKRTQRLAAGYYRIHTDVGSYDVTRTLPKAETGWPVSWAITYPGRQSADSVTDTLWEAKNAILADVLNREGCQRCTKSTLHR